MARVGGAWLRGSSWGNQGSFGTQLQASEGVRRQLEKAVAIAWDEGTLALEGIFIAGSGVAGAVIAPPHPLYGGAMESPVVTEIAFACEKAGVASLRFNWRGVGASAGKASGEADDADADIEAALAYLEETVAGGVVACGYSFGASAALRVAGRHPRVNRLVMVSPPPALLDAAAFAAYPGRILVVTGGRDSFAPVAEIERLVDSARQARLEIVPEADHFFGVGLATISRVAGVWLEASDPDSGSTPSED
jgi:alpha/beta superfamily hydrolase